MFIVIFEVQPRKEHWDDYLDIAKQLKPKLEAIDGFIDNERFASHRTEGRLLSLSTWRDEKSVIRWRTQGEHHCAQQRGRFEVFADYRLRVGEVTDDSSGDVVLRQQRFDETANSVAKAVSITELAQQDDGPSISIDERMKMLGFDPTARGLVDHEVFESIYNPGKFVLLMFWRDAEATQSWIPKPQAGALRHRRVRIIRAYGMTDRMEAPQFFPDTRSRDLAAE
jgi:heme-degrading monooxygenase HmoA